ncbi:hypothetical protein VSDG_04502 [Cytospora chrysosperma]|uniref:Nnf1-domain-containing protein n=1 Tax=Cytospora chrysosperma TaxID=252740 RepID=A0A423W4C3_CYTCH|nr:hypothetical protein VSDG_04502 [Valsa sordida]
MATSDQPPRPPTDTNAPTAPADDNVNNQQPHPQSSQAPPPQPPASTSTSSDAAEPSLSQSQPPPPPAATTMTTSTTPEPAPASPPLPTRHTAVTPGPRAQRFQEMFDLALSRTLTRISPDNFASCYPTIAAQAPHVLRQVQRAMVDRFAELCAQGFADALARYGAVAKLNELEGLVESARQPPTPPHMLPAEAILAAHLAPHLAGQQGQMNARLQNTQAANVALWDEIQKQRAEVEELLGALERALADVDGAAALMDGVPAEELARESRAVEAEMADV